MSDEAWPSLDRSGAVFLLLASSSFARRVPMPRRVVRSPGRSRGRDAGAMLGAIDLERVRPRGVRVDGTSDARPDS